MDRLRKRADFLAAAKAQRVHTPGFVLQARACGTDEVRVGFTCSKKVGNAVARNRAKRRLRALAQAALPKGARPGHDYVLIGRKDVTATLPFDRLVQDLTQALAKVHAS